MLECPVTATTDEPLAVGAEGHAQDGLDVTPESLLITVDDPAKIGIFPTPQVGAAGVEQFVGTVRFIVLPFAMGQINLAGIDEPLRPFSGRFGLLALQLLPF